MTLAHEKAIKALIRPDIKAYLYEAELSTPPVPSDYPFVVLWPGLQDEFSGDPGDDTSDGVVTGQSIEVRCTYAALSGGELSVLVSQVRADLNRARPVVAGWGPGRLKQVQLTEPRADRDVPVGSLGAHPVYMVDEYTTLSYKKQAAPVAPAPI